jgi:hypothetical protein
VQAAGYDLLPTSNASAPSFVRTDSTDVDRGLLERAARDAP